MLQIQRIGQDEFTLNASQEEWASIRTILEHAIEVHGDTELETILQLSKEEFSNKVDAIAYQDSFPVALDESDVHLLFNTIGELRYEEVSGISEENHKTIQSGFAQHSLKRLLDDGENNHFVMG